VYDRWIIAAASCCITVIGVGFAWHGPGDTTDAPNRVLRQDTTRHEEGTNVVERELGELRGRIAGREKQPATEVFKNIQLFKTMEAGRLPGDGELVQRPGGDV